MSAFLTHQRIGILLAIVGAVLFSTKGVLVKLSYEEGLSTIAIIALRMSFSLPFFVWIGWQAWRKADTQLSGRDWLMIATCGVLSYYLATWLSFYGLHYISAQLERLILFSYPAIVVLITALMRRSFPSLSILGAAALTYLGILFVFGQEFSLAGDGAITREDVVIGSVLVGLAALSFAIFVILAKPLITKLGSALFTGLSMGVSAFAVLAHVSVSGTISGVFVFSGITPMALIYGLIIGVFGTVLPALMLNEANGRIGPERTAVLGTTGPMATSVMAVWILGESFTVWHGGALVFCVAGVSLIMRSTQRF